MVDAVLVGDADLGPYRGLSALNPGVDAEREWEPGLLADVWDSKMEMSWVALPGGGSVTSPLGSVAALPCPPPVPSKAERLRLCVEKAPDEGRVEASSVRSVMRLRRARGSYPAGGGLSALPERYEWD